LPRPARCVLRPGLTEFRLISNLTSSSIDIYYGIMGFVLTINSLRNPWHAQAIAASARSILELHVDLAILHRTTDAEAAERFHTFTDVERLRVHKALVEYFDQHPSDPYWHDVTELRTAIAADESRVTAEAARLWPGNTGRITHWAGNRDFFARSDSVGLGGLYRRFYGRLSWLAHTSKVGTDGLDRDAVGSVIANALECVRLTVPDSLATVAEELHIVATIDDFSSKVQFIKNVFAYSLIATKLGRRQ
jgi:hypothetical protein